eukprot:Platyproteum_vivax@DN9020_c0_g1_i1.p1
MEKADQSLEEVLTDLSSLEKLMQDPITLLGYLTDVACAMTVIHKHLGKQSHVLHRDLKPANILLKGSRALVSDFGVSRCANILYEGTNFTYDCGTDGYKAPELKTPIYDRGVDVFAFGVTIRRLLGLSNWKADRLENGRVNKKESMIEPRIQDCKFDDSFLFELSQLCCLRDPILRPSFAQLHQYLFQEVVRRSNVDTWKCVSLDDSVSTSTANSCNSVNPDASDQIKRRRRKAH